MEIQKAKNPFKEVVFIPKNYEVDKNLNIVSRKSSNIEKQVSLATFAKVSEKSKEPDSK